jgi:DNA-binding MarR family transcriptional regulator
LEYLRALRALSGARIQDIADSLGTTVGAASKLTDRLVADGLVQRLPHPTDRRSSLVQLTSAGAAALATGEAAFEESIAAIIGTLDVETVATLSSLLRTAQAAVANAEVEK